MTHVESLAKRKNVVCTNPECPWHGERKVATALDGPCPKCSSAVRFALPEQASSELQALVEAVPEPVPAQPKPAKRPYFGPQRFSLEEVRVGPAARQMLVAAGGGRRALAEVAGELLDRLAAETNGRAG